MIKNERKRNNKTKKTMLNLRTMYREVVATLCILIKSAVFSLQSSVSSLLLLSSKYRNICMPYLEEMYPQPTTSSCLYTPYYVEL